ncbi:MAG: acyltransferase [Clostridia bacterium]|nr:acyltransferase [Clostridia bacterium]
MEQISKKIRVIGFIMTCFMVFYHCGDYDNSLAVNSIDSWFNTGFNHVFSIMGRIIMAWFFTVTGFLLMHGLSFANYPKKMKRRCFSLLIPYVLWQVIITIKQIIVNHAAFSLKGFLYQNFALVKWPSDGALWYVYAVFILAVFAPILLVLFKNRNVGFILLICIVAAIQFRGSITNATFQAIINYGLLPNILSYLPAYLIGAFYGKFYDELKAADSLKYVLLLLFVSRLLFFADFSLIAVLIMPILGIYLFPNINRFADLKIYKLTFLMYALHQPIIVDFRPHILNVMGLIIRPAVCMNLFNRIAILMIDIMFAAVIYIVFKKVCPFILKLLTGGRI